MLYGAALSKDDVAREITVYAGFIKHCSSISNKVLSPHCAAALMTLCCLPRIALSLGN